MFKMYAIMKDAKKVVNNMKLDSLQELRAMQKPSIDIEDMMAAVIMICEFYGIEWLRNSVREYNGAST